jgi:hypothetical protein
MLKIGATAISKLQHGGLAVLRAYFGTQQVFPEQVLTPIDFTTTIVAGTGAQYKQQSWDGNGLPPPPFREYDLHGFRSSSFGAIGSATPPATPDGIALDAVAVQLPSQQNPTAIPAIVVRMTPVPRGYGAATLYIDGVQIPGSLTRVSMQSNEFRLEPYSDAVAQFMTDGTSSSVRVVLAPWVALPAPAYSITTNQSLDFVGENTKLKFAIANANALDGAMEQYTITGIDQADLMPSSSPLVGYVSTGSVGGGDVHLDFRPDAIVEGTETVTIAIGSHSISFQLYDTSVPAEHVQYVTTLTVDEAQITNPTNVFSRGFGSWLSPGSMVPDHFYGSANPVAFPDGVGLSSVAEAHGGFPAVTSFFRGSISLQNVPDRFVKADLFVNDAIWIEDLDRALPGGTFSKPAESYKPARLPAAGQTCQLRIVLRAPL